MSAAAGVQLLLLRILRAPQILDHARLQPSTNYGGAPLDSPCQMTETTGTRAVQTMYVLLSLSSPSSPNTQLTSHIIKFTQVHFPLQKRSSMHVYAQKLVDSGKVKTSQQRFTSTPAMQTVCCCMTAACAMLYASKLSLWRYERCMEIYAGCMELGTLHARPPLHFV